MMIEYKKCQRIFCDQEIEVIKKIVKIEYNKGRCRISREVCRELNWYSENGKPKEWICREFLLSLEKQQVIKLPPPNPISFNRFIKNKKKINFKEPEKSFFGTLSNHPLPVIKRVKTTQENKLWDHLVKKYHYLGYKGHVGRFLKYIAYIEEIPVACLGFTGAALKVAARDAYLGIQDDNRFSMIKHIVNNFRFVILPWSRIKYLASHILSKNIPLLLADWQQVYNIKVQFLETFIEKNRFKGTCYQAANWLKVGETKGYKKTKTSYKKHNIIKEVYLYQPKCKRRAM